MLVIENPSARGDSSLLSDADALLSSFHKRLPAYTPTPLVEVPSLARRLGIARVLVKDDGWRFGLPAFKMLGASWATYRSLIEMLGYEPEWRDVGELRDALRSLGAVTLVTATDGNHGRAIARIARWLDCEARIFMPLDSSSARIDAIRAEGATVELVEGDYEGAVDAARLAASPSSIVISDTSWEGYVDRPRWVMEGYSTLFSELREQIAAQALPFPSVVAVPLGVGALGAAAVTHFRRNQPTPTLVGVEPRSAACILASVAAGKIVQVNGPHPSIMAGLNCGRPSREAFPIVEQGFDWFTAIGDQWAELAMVELAGEGIVAGETGAASLAGLLALARWADARDARTRAGLDKDAVALVIVTEGATDPTSYERIVGHGPERARESSTVRQSQ